LLEAVHLTKRYSSLPAVQDLNFTLRPGQVLGCLGPNGSGKSTTVKMLTGLLEPTQGAVLFNGRKIRDDLPAYRKLLGYVPEEALLYPYLSGWEYLELIGSLRSMRPSEMEKRIDSLLELFSLHSHRHAAIGSYSKGMRQRILLIAALMDNPEIFIFDEPHRLLLAGFGGLGLVLASQSLLASFVGGPATADSCPRTFFPSR
jgi:ABC-2 type transport system ATP-binding protein